MKRSAGLTLLEVLVAISILALSITAIFAAEGGAIKMAAETTQPRKRSERSPLMICSLAISSSASSSTAQP